MTLALIAAVFFLGLNVFFVLAEFSLVRTQPSRLEVMQSQGRTRASVALNMVRHLDHYLSAIQIGVTMSTLGVGWVGEPTITRLIVSRLHWPAFLSAYSEPLSTAVSFALIIYAQIVFAELVPRAIAIHKAEGLVLWLSVPLEAYYRLIRLPTLFLSKSAILFIRLLGMPPVGEHEQVFSEEEMKVLLSASQEKGLLPLDRLLLFENLFDFGALRVRDAMVPRDKIVYLSTAKSWDENLAIVRARRFSRYPLADPDLDHVSGVVHIKDLNLFSDNRTLSEIKRRIGTVGDGEKLQTVLGTMAARGGHLMLATSGGRVSGLITLEDVIEEIVGEIHDEFDAPNAWSLNQFLSPETIDIDLKTSSVAETLPALAQRLKTVEPGLNVEAVVRAVNQRESKLPTAIGKGVAVPHARLQPLRRTLVAVGRSAKGVGFPSPDKVPVRLIFLLLTPASAPLEQLRFLSRIATLVNNNTVRRQLLKARTPQQLLEALRTSESLLMG